MSPLPQRKKSAEEIQQLRGELGIRQNKAPTAEEPAQQKAASSEEEIPSPRPAARKRVIRSFKRSEREAFEQERNTPQSNQASSSPAIPARRHSRDELEELRRREALSNFSPAGQVSPFPRPASPFLITPGYLLAFFCWACQYWKQIPLEATAGAGTGALLIAGWICYSRKPSRHHSSFIAIITLLALAFAALHYFPDLKYAS